MSTFGGGIDQGIEDVGQVDLPLGKRLEHGADIVAYDRNRIIGLADDLAGDQFDEVQFRFLMGQLPARKRREGRAHRTLDKGRMCLHGSTFPPEFRRHEIVCGIKKQCADLLTIAAAPYSNHACLPGF